MAGSLGLVKLTREVSVADLRKQADQTPRVILYGTAEERAQLRELLEAGVNDVIERSLLAASLAEVGVPLQEQEIAPALPAQVILTKQPVDNTLLRLKIPVFRVTDEHSLREAAGRLADMEEEWVLGLGRHVPAFRPVMAERVVAATSSANAQIALISALPGVAPIAGILLPPAAAADIVLLTKNQIMMVLKVAAMYGKPMQISARLAELAPVVGSAFGWRALARELVGMVPGGVGVVAKGTVAYAGTYTIGRAAHLFYQRGHHISREERRNIYRAALDRGRKVAESLLARLRRKPGEPPAPPSELTVIEPQEKDVA